MVRAWVEHLEDFLIRRPKHHFCVPFVVKDVFTRAVIMLYVVGVGRNIDVLVHSRLNNQGVNVVFPIIVCKYCAAIHRLVIILKYETTVMHLRDIEVEVCVL